MITNREKENIIDNSSLSISNEINKKNENIKISVYIILFHDLGFLNDIINNIIDIVDEIVIIDGPYVYNINILKELNLFYDSTCIPEELIKILIMYSNKVKYIYDVYDCQEKKRMVGYDACKNDLVLMIDCDEFFSINLDYINKFVLSDKKVASCWIYNMNRVNVNMDQKVLKNILFKKNQLSSLEHLAYTWSCNSANNLPNSEYIYNENVIGEIFHLTLNRSKFDSIIKYIYYISLFFYNKNKEIMDANNLPLIAGQTIRHLIDAKLSVDEILDVFYHSTMELIGIPGNDRILTLNNEVTINLNKYNNNHNFAIFKKKSIAIRNIPFYCLVPIDESCINVFEFLFENVSQIEIIIYQINFDEKYEIFKNNYRINTDKLNIKHVFTKKTNYFSTVVMFNCIHTIDDTLKYKIKRINIKLNKNS
jgi:hypothetical protein